jgi:hypothetical protein
MPQKTRMHNLMGKRMAKGERKSPGRGKKSKSEFGNDSKIKNE